MLRSYRIHLDPDDRIRIGSVVYAYVETTEQGHRLRRVADPDRIDLVSHDDLAQAEQSGNYRRNRGFFGTSSAEARARSGVDNLFQIPKAELPRILVRWEFAHRIISMRLNRQIKASNAEIQQAIQAIAEDIQDLDFVQAYRAQEQAAGKGAAWVPGYRSVQRWLKILEECGWEIASLRTRYRLSGKTSGTMQSAAAI